MPQLQKSEIQLSNGKKFCIIHNLPDFRLDIDAALQNWLARTDEFTDESFCKYIRSKDPVNIIALTEKKYNELVKSK